MKRDYDEVLSEYGISAYDETSQGATMTQREELDHIPYSNKMMEYKGWPIVDVMPDGWVIDKTVGSPLSGHDFITNGKSVLNGQKRALLRVKSLPSGISQLTKPKPMVISEPTKHVDQVIDRDYLKTVNDLARAKFKKKMLSDILCDMQICEIEGWCKLDYLNEIRELINNLCGDVVVSELKKSEAAVPEVNKAILQSLRDMVEIVGANFCSNQDVKRKYKIARELLEKNK